MYELIATENPMTVRQVFYRLVATGMVAKTESEYGSTVCRLLKDMRLDGDIPFHWIADNTRWMRKPKTFSGLGQVVDSSWRHYRRALWENQDAYVEVWIEKEALAGVVYQVTGEWDVPLMVTKGFASLTFLYEAAETIESEEKDAYIYFLGDYDPAGLNIAYQVEDRLREFAPTSDISFERVAVTPEQIDELQLPTRPTKARGRGNFAGDSVELDAIPPEILRTLVRDCIDRHVDSAAFLRLKQVEESERELLKRLMVGVRKEAQDSDERSDEALEDDEA